MMKKLLPLLAIVFLLISTPTFASSNKPQEKRDESKLEIKVNTNNNRAGNDDSDDNDKKDEHSEKIKIEDDNREFEIRGEISSIVGNSFVISGQTIKIDPSKVDKFKLKGILEVGNTAKVEGVVVGEVKYAEEVKLIGTGQGRFKVEISGVTSGGIPSPTPSPTPSGSPSASPSATPSVTPSPSPTPDVSASVKIKAVGPVDKVINFLQQILGFLGNIDSSSPDASPTPSPSTSPSPSPELSPTPSVSPSPIVSPSPTPEVSPSPIPSVTPSPTVTPSPSPSAEPSPAISNIKIKLGPTPIVNIFDVLKTLIGALQNLV